MRKIKSKNTKQELKLRRALWALGYRYRKNLTSLPGKPDIVYPKYKLAIFVDGEFWHGFNWQEKKEKIQTNRAFWVPKIERNMQRDKQNNQLLIDNGWHVMRFWEKGLKEDFDGCVQRIIGYIHEKKPGQNRM
ncbi:MAG: very short patch repair endonuclease [Bacteroidales bacterium]|nr:very short patch repair endonuclease [Bacteroidales bacterium]